MKILWLGPSAREIEALHSAIQWSSKSVSDHDRIKANSDVSPLATHTRPSSETSQPADRTTLRFTGTVESIASDELGAMSIPPSLQWTFPIDKCVSLERLSSIDHYTSCDVIGIVIDIRPLRPSTLRKWPSLLLTDEGGSTLEVTCQKQCANWLMGKDTDYIPPGSVIQRLDIVHLGQLKLFRSRGTLCAAANPSTGSTYHIVVAHADPVPIPANKLDLRSRKIRALLQWRYLNIQSI